MELRDLILIFQKQKILYFVIILVFIFSGLVWQKEQDEVYQATLLINIGRAGEEETTDYTYDSFYRLQADERFADTVVRWFSSPRVVEDIYKEARLGTDRMNTKALGQVFSAGRLSSQFISVKYSGKNRSVLKQLAVSSVTVLNRYTETLNTEQKKKNWFVILGSDPVIHDGRVTPQSVLLFSLALGIFVGFWVILLRHYLTVSTYQSAVSKKEVA